ncbi:MAG: porin family protein [Candidatus Zixiibacteriota bacterium]
MRKQVSCIVGYADSQRDKTCLWSIQHHVGLPFGTKAFLIGIMLAFIIMLSVSSAAQANVDIGLKGGASLARFKGQNILYNVDTKNGFTVGGLLTVNVNDYLAIQPEILFVQKGTNGSVSAFEFSFQGIRYHEGYWEDRLSYLEVPVLAKLTIPVEAKVEPALFVGPFFAIKLKAEEKWESTFSDSNGVFLEHSSGIADISDRFNDVDIGVAVGGDLKFNVRFAKVFVDVRYTLSLTHIDKQIVILDSKIGTHGFSDMRNKVVAITAGVVFPLNYKIR